MKTENGDWGMRVIDTMHDCYCRIFEDFGFDIDRIFLADGWQLNATLESIRPMFPTVAWGAVKNLNMRARVVGGILGHSVAHQHALYEPKIWQLICRGFKALAEVVPVDDPEEFELSEQENPFLETRKQFDRALRRSLGFVAAEPTIVHAQFFEAYTKALRRGSITMEARGVGESTRTTAYQLIAAFGPLLKLHWCSVHDVHRFLVAMLGSQRAGTIKRTEAVCKSLNMRLRSSGRPVKAALNTPEAS